jgi:hypothetical protein
MERELCFALRLRKAEVNLGPAPSPEAPLQTVDFDVGRT